MSDTLALASRLQGESDEALVTLLTARHLAKRDLRDFFDLADALLSPESVNSALSHLDRPTLAAIASASAPRVGASVDLVGAVSSMLLFDDNGILKPYDGVAAVLQSWPSLGLPSTAELGGVPAPEVPTHTSDARRARAQADLLAGERALETTVAVTELVIALTASSARELAKGGL